MSDRKMAGTKQTARKTYMRKYKRAFLKDLIPNQDKNDANFSDGCKSAVDADSSSVSAFYLYSFLLNYSESLIRRSRSGKIIKMGRSQLIELNEDGVNNKVGGVEMLLKIEEK